MFVIVYQNSVILGPMRWNRFRFQNTIFEDCEEFSVTLPDRNDDFTPIIVSDDIKILPVQGTPNPDYNPKIEILHGPFYEFTDTVAISSYTVEPMHVESVKNQLKAVIANNRYNKEIAGVTVKIQNNDVKVDTTRESRQHLIHRYILMNDDDTLQWKFNDVWLTLSKEEVSFLVTSGANHVQTHFDWEADKVKEINSANTLQELDLIILE